MLSEHLGGKAALQEMMLSIYMGGKAALQEMMHFECLGALLNRRGHPHVACMQCKPCRHSISTKADVQASALLGTRRPLLHVTLSMAGAE